MAPRIAKWSAVLAMVMFSVAVADARPGNADDKAHPSDSPSAWFDGPAELPRAYVRSSLADTQAPGKTWKVKSGDDFQSVLDRAGCGDTVALEAGAIFAGSAFKPNAASRLTCHAIPRSALLQVTLDAM